MHPVGAARLHEVGPVVEDEERPELAELLRGGDEPVVVERLVAELHDVDAAAYRRGQPLAWPGVAYEVEAGGPDALARAHGATM